MRLKMLFVLIFSLAICNLYPQSGGLSKSEVLGVLNNVNNLNLNSDQVKELESASTKAVDNLFDIADGGFSPDEMNSKFKLAKNENQKVFKEILGDNNFKKYQKQVKKELRPLKRKAKLVGFLI